MLFLFWFPAAPLFCQNYGPVVISSLGDSYSGIIGPQSITVGENIVNTLSVPGIKATTGFQQPEIYTAPITMLTDTGAAIGNTAVMPIRVFGFTGMDTMKLRIEYDSTLLTFTSHTNVNLSISSGVQLNDTTISGAIHAILIRWSSAIPVTLSHYSKLMDLNFTHVSGNIASLTFNNESNGGKDCRYHKAGGSTVTDQPSGLYYHNGTIFTPATVSGTFSYYYVSNSGLDSINLVLKKNNEIFGFFSTNSSGYYLISNIPMGEYNLEASTKKIWKSVNSTDALKIQREFAGLENWSEPVKLLAGDVDNSNYINGTDALLVKKRFLGQINLFNRGDWTFSLPAIGGNAIIVNSVANTDNFYGLCVGDVNSSYVPFTGKSFQNEVELVQEQIIGVSQAQEIEIPLRLKTGAQIGAITLKINYPSELLTIRDVSFSKPGLLFSIYKDQVRIVWSELDPIQVLAEDILITLHVKISEKFSSSSVVRFSLDEESELADSEGEPLSNMILSAPVLKALSSGNTAENDPLIANCRIYPNPASTVLNVVFSLAQEVRVSIGIEGLLGNNCKQNEFGLLPAGSHQYKVDVSDLPNGIYFIYFRTGNDAAGEIRKIIIAR